MKFFLHPVNVLKYKCCTPVFNLHGEYDGKNENDGSFITSRDVALFLSTDDNFSESAINYNPNDPWRLSQVYFCPVKMYQIWTCGSNNVVWTLDHCVLPSLVIMFVLLILKSYGTFLLRGKCIESVVCCISSSVL